MMATQKEVLNFKPAPRLEQIGDKCSKQIDDRILPDRIFGNDNVRNAQLPATAQWLRKLASTVNEELRYRANRAISHGHDPNR